MEHQLKMSAVAVDAQIEEMRCMLRNVYRSLSGEDTTPANLEGLVGALLRYGVSQADIAFLIGEAVPPVASPALESAHQKNWDSNRE